MNYNIQKSEQMEVILFQNRYDSNDSFDEFLDVLFYREMKYFASDLLEKGINLEDIQQGVKQAMRAAERAGLDIRRHFTMVYTSYQGALIRDCKLSKVGYALLLLNANVNNPIVANWQLQLVEHFLDEHPAKMITINN